jgi:RimJ/RimL family protein N-acetyltransferase
MQMYKGTTVILRPFEKKDFEDYRKWVNNPVIASLVDRALPVTKQEHEEWCSALVENKNAVVFAITSASDACYIGNVWLWGIDWRHRKAELRIIVGDENYHGKGLGTEAIELITMFAFKKLNLNRIFAYVLNSNERAKKAFEKAGFSVEGVLKRDRFIDGQYQDVFLMAILREK